MELENGGAIWIELPAAGICVGCGLRNSLLDVVHCGCGIRSVMAEKFGGPELELEAGISTFQAGRDVES
jgi:hypothetical protein